MLNAAQASSWNIFKTLVRVHLNQSAKREQRMASRPSYQHRRFTHVESRDPSLTETLFAALCGGSDSIMTGVLHDCHKKEEIRSQSNWRRVLGEEEGALSVPAFYTQIQSVFISSEVGKVLLAY